MGTIEAAWQLFFSSVLEANNFSPAMKENLKRVFFTGAMSTISNVDCAADDMRISQEEYSDYIRNLHQEGKEFFQEVQRIEARRN